MTMASPSLPPFPLRFAPSAPLTHFSVCPSPTTNSSSPLLSTSCPSPLENPPTSIMVAVLPEIDLTVLHPRFVVLRALPSLHSLSSYSLSCPPFNHFLPHPPQLPPLQQTLALGIGKQLKSDEVLPSRTRILQFMTHTKHLVRKHMVAAALCWAFSVLYFTIIHFIY